MDFSYNQNVSKVVKTLDSNLENGINMSNIKKLRKRYGRNELSKLKSKSFLSLVLDQFKDLLVIILLISALISFFIGFLDSKDSFIASFIEPFVILLILFANAIVGVVQETNAASAIERLKEFESKIANVIRNGEIKSINASELLPGDIIRLEVGERIPADCRLAEIRSMGNFRCDESMLTGESMSKRKQIEPIKESSDLVVQDMHNMLFSGSLVVKGYGTAIVVKIGKETQLGKIHTGLKKVTDGDKRTPLQEKLDVFAAQLSKAIFAICVLVWIVNIGHFTDPQHGSIFKGAIYYFKIAVSLAVAAIPEGLPAVVTTCLALGMVRMARKKAIVRSLPSVETLGCTTVVCSDKTGTLTTNKMNVRSVLVVRNIGEVNENLSFEEFNVTGSDYSPKGSVFEVSTGNKIMSYKDDKQLKKIVEIGSFCNEAMIKYEKDGSGFKSTGMPIEIALKVFLVKLNYKNTPKNGPKNFHKNKRICFFDFNQTRKMMSTIDIIDEKTFCHVKGAPEIVIDRCDQVLLNDGKIAPLNNHLKTEILNKMQFLTNKGQRVLGLAFSPTTNSKNPKDFSSKLNEENFFEHEKNLIFTGFCGFLDPVRKEVPQAVARCINSGIRLVVITGDHKFTAESVCRKIGFFGTKGVKSALLEKSMSGAAFMALPVEKRAIYAEKISLFYRVEPRHKYELVKLLKQNGHVVAMTGDGVNDASALQCADVGIAMGSGTKVAQHASKIILQDDNFSTIVNAIEEGRTIFANTKQFIRYLISSNIGEVVCVFLTALLGIPEVLIPVQLLWVNLVTDGLPATALGFNPADKETMECPPRKRNEPIIDRWLFFRYLLVGTYIGCATVFAFIWWFVISGEGPQITFSQLKNFHKCEQNKNIFPVSFDCSVFTDLTPSTLSLSVLVTIEMFNALNAVSENLSLFTVAPWRNLYVIGAISLSFVLHFAILYIEFFRNIFSTVALSFEQWIFVVVLCLPILAIDEVLKAITRTFCKKKKRNGFKDKKVD